VSAVPAKFGFGHLLAAALEYVDADEHDAMFKRAEELATKKAVKLGSIKVGDFVMVDWYLPKREASISGACVVTAIDEQGLHLEPTDAVANVSFGDGATGLSLLRGMGPVNERRARKVIKAAWRFVPYEATP